MQKLFLAPIVYFCLAIGPNLARPSADSTYKTWSDYGGTADSAQYSALTQINRENVTRLRVAWTYSTGDSRKYAFNPLQADGRLYVLAKNNSIVALDAISGKQLWAYQVDSQIKLITNRGINYWKSRDGSGRRLFFAVNNALQAIDAQTGKRIDSFGTNGSVDLRQGLGRDPSSVVLVQSLSPGRVFEDLLILGSATNQEYESAPGDIRAYDVRTGKMMWSFHTVPHPGEAGYETWPKEAWKTVGGANAWSELSVDEARGIVYIPTGSPKYNFYGANRPGANLYGDCLLALDARTGKHLWHFQMVHHDIWDYDAATAPKLITVRHNGRAIDAVAQASKQGFLWVFDRFTGEPLWPIEERSVPKSDMPGEETWPTQPFPTKPPPFARQKFTADDLSPFIDNPDERARLRDEIQGARNEGLFTPPGIRNTIQMPGNNGGANWGGAAADPLHGMVYVVSKDLPAMLKLEPETKLDVPESGTAQVRGLAVYRAKCQVCHHADLKGQPPAVPSLQHLTGRLTQQQVVNIVQYGQGLMPATATLSQAHRDDLISFLFRQDGTAAYRKQGGANAAAVGDASTMRYRTGFGFMTTSAGLSPIKPPWTSLTAYDLNIGTIQWKIALGEVPKLAAKGFADTGTYFPKVGPVVTAGGLIFTGTNDHKVRALDQRTGAVLWEVQLDSALDGMPAVYEAGGKEYVVFCAAGRLASGEETSGQGAYVAFTLAQ